jgi:hypothetical protein
MIIAQNNNKVEIKGNNLKTSGKMHLSEEGENHIIRMLTKAYSDPIGSIIRESMANAVDSHRMANNPNPVICRIQRENNQWYFEAIDNGLGLDDVEFEKYIMGIGESTKRGLANVIGG